MFKAGSNSEELVKKLFFSIKCAVSWIHYHGFIHNSLCSNLMYHLLI